MADIFKFNDIAKKDLSILVAGGVGVLPTDTIYGLVTSVNNPKSVKRLYDLKSRENKPGTIIASNVQQIIDLGIEQKYIEAARRFWPNPISIILPADDSLSYAHQGKNSLAFRVVSDPEVRALLNITGPLLTSSANQPDMPVASNLDEAKEYFGETVDFYIDGGNIENSTASAVIKIDEGGMVVLRDNPILNKYKKSNN
jgi:L-threonylcarbamoyladenylate synthase